jgi:kinesin family protein 4/21/27
MFQKEEMKQFAKSDTSVLKQHYEKKLNELEQEKKALQVFTSLPC